MSNFDERQVRMFWDIMRNGNELTEIRLISNDGRTASGYFSDPDTMINAVRPYTNDFSTYFVFNKLNPDVYGRPQRDKIMLRPKNTSTDGDVLCRDAVFLDIDSVRASGVNATEEQLNAAKKKANEVYRFLKDQGFYTPIVVCSGSGVHLYLKCALLANEENDKLIKRFTLAMDMLFSDETVKIDSVTHNRCRLSRVPGYYNRKGSNADAERPQRLCSFVKIPDEWRVNDKDYFKKVADMYPEEVRPTRENNYSVEKFDLDSFIEKHNIPVTHKVTVADGTRYHLEHCLFNSEHRGRDAILFRHNNGAIAYFCYHNSCSSNDWRKVRLMYEPDAYSRSAYVPQPRFGRYGTPKEPFVPTPETEEKGRKWLQMSDIKRVDVDSLMSIPTGFDELDRKIVGLYAGDLTVLSGLAACGKTSWLDCLALNVVDQGYKVAIWSGEMQDWRFQGWIHQIAAGKSYARKKHGYENLYYVPNNIADKVDEWLDDKLFLYNNDYGNRVSQLMSDIKVLVEEKGVQLIILDNLAALNIEDYDSDKYSNQTKFILELKEYIKKKNIHGILVAHPRKQNYFLRREGISGSADLTNIADNCILLHRVGKDFETRAKEFFGEAQALTFMQYSSVIEVSKNRQWGVTDHLVGLYYEPESRRLKNSVAENVIYGWYEQPTQSAIFNGSDEFNIPVEEDVWRETYNFDGDESPF